MILQLAWFFLEIRNEGDPQASTASDRSSAEGESSSTGCQTQVPDKRSTNQGSQYAWIRLQIKAIQNFSKTGIHMTVSHVVHASMAHPAFCAT